MTVASATVRMGSLDIGFPPHGALCIRNGAAAGRLLLHGTVNPIPALRGGMPPLGATGKNRAAAADLGRNGPGLGEACEGDRSGRLLFATLIGMLLGIVRLRQAQPYLCHLQQGGARFRVLDGVAMSKHSLA